MTKKLKTLEEFNSGRYHVYNFPMKEPVPNGIACPNCGEELYDSDPSVILNSNPPQKNTICFNCKYTGYRVDRYGNIV